MKWLGLAVHGCIDGWMLHLQIRIHLLLQGIFLQAVKSIGELLVRICSDAETENNLIEAMQIAIRSQHNTTMNILVWEIILLVRLQLIKEI